MGKSTAISWTDHTFSPWWGCQRVSPGCGMGKSVGGCYAEAWAKRTGHAVWGPTAPRRFFSDKHWAEPMSWNRQAEREGVHRRVFCASMCDVFERRDDLVEPRRRLGALIRATPHLDWLLLTKRPENVTEMTVDLEWVQEWPTHAWLGTTTENQEYFEKRVAILGRIRGPVVRFLSMEPLIGPVRFGVDPEATTDRFGLLSCPGCGGWGYGSSGGIDVNGHPFERECGLCHGSGTAVDLIIVGGESGPGPRPFDLQWARDIRDECKAASVPYFFKQAGANPVDGLVPLRLKDRSHGADINELPEDLRIRESPV